MSAEDATMGEPSAPQPPPTAPTPGASTPTLGKRARVDTAIPEILPDHLFMQTQLQTFINANNINNTPLNKEVTNITTDTYLSDESITLTSLLLIQDQKIAQLQSSMHMMLTQMKEYHFATSQKVDQNARKSDTTLAAIRSTVDKQATEFALLNAGQFQQQPPPPKPQVKTTTPKNKSSSKDSTAPANTPQPKTPAAEDHKPWTKVEKKEKAKPAPLPAASRRIFATRESPAPVQDAERLTTTLPAIIAKAIKEAGHTKPTPLTVNINDNTGTVTITTDKNTPATELKLYVGHITNVVNKAINTPSNSHDLFRLAPTTVDLALDMIPNIALQGLHDLLLPQEINDQIMLTANVKIDNARYLQRDEHIHNYREEGTKKRFCSLVITLDTNEAKKLGDTINLYSRNVKIRKMVNVTLATQCKKCMSFGHHTTLCKEEKHTCSMCAGEHATNQHRCTDPKCEGFKTFKRECCTLSRSLNKCLNCDGNHPATAPDCPLRKTKNDQVKLAIEQRKKNRVSVQQENPPATNE
jgi:hypothetical protein